MRRLATPLAGCTPARSRNDQIALDVRMFVKDAITEVLNAIHALRTSLVGQAEANDDAVMPGYTHVQRAQPVLFAHHMLAYFEMLARDADRFRQAYRRSDALPLGSGALAGLPYPIDREFVARELGFSHVSRNSMDAVSDRDFLLDFHAAAAICMMHLSRMAEELVLWSSDEFAFIRLSEEYTTGSSIMPQKRNPDFAELARGKTGRVYGSLTAAAHADEGLAPHIQPRHARGQGRLFRYLRYAARYADDFRGYDCQDEHSA